MKLAVFSTKSGDGVGVNDLEYLTDGSVAPVRGDDMEGEARTRIFWCHPRLTDYRKPLFDKVHSNYRVEFFFRRRSEIDHRYDVVYGKERLVSRTLPISDLVHLYTSIQKSDIFISSFLFSKHSIAGIAIARMLQKKIIIWEELSHFFEGVRPATKYWASHTIAKYVDAFFVLGEPQRRALRQLGVSRERIFIANEYPGHVYSRVEPSKIESLAVDGREIILYLGRFIPVKGVEYLLEAYSLLERKHSNTLLLIVGYGPLERELKKKAEHLRIKSVQFLGPITDVRQKKYLFESSRMLVVPSIIQKGKGTEGGPLVVLEALSAGTPVVGTDGLVSSAQFISNGVSGFIVPHSDSQTLFKKMEEVLNWGNPQEVRKRIQAEFDSIKGFSHQFDIIDRAIRYCVSGTHPPAR